MTPIPSYDEPRDTPASGGLGDPAGYLLHGSASSVRMFLSPLASVDGFIEAGETVEPVYTASQVEVARSKDAAEIARWAEALDEATTAASETQPSWKHRCVAIMGALGMDFGDPDWMLPGDRHRLEAALARVAQLEELLQEKAMSQPEMELFVEAERELVGHSVVYYPHDEDIWQVWRISESPAAWVGSHRTRWDAIAAAALADRPFKT